MDPIRSMLYVPGNKEDWVIKAPQRNDADGFLLDLEDSVPDDEKGVARSIIREAYDDFAEFDVVTAVRVNGVHSGFFEDDLHDIVFPGLDAIVLPEIATAEEVRHLDYLLTYLERVRDISQPIEIIALPEKPSGLDDLDEICSASDRVVAAVGASAPGDLQRELGFEFTREGSERYYLLSKAVLGARIAGVDQLIGGVWVDIEDITGLKAEAELHRQFGYTGMPAIHPNQVDPLNEVFTPDSDAIERAQRLIQTVNEAEGTTAIRFEGELADTAHVKAAERVLDRARAFGIIK